MAIEQPSSTLCCHAKCQLKLIVEPSWNKTSVFLKKDGQFFPEPLHAHENSKVDCMGLLTDLKKKMQQTKLHAPHLVLVEIPVHPLLLNIINTVYMGTQKHCHNQKRKTLPQEYRSHFCIPSLSNGRRSIATRQ